VVEDKTLADSSHQTKVAVIPSRLEVLKESSNWVRFSSIKGNWGVIYRKL